MKVQKVEVKDRIRIVGGGLPDIDTDYQGLRRDDVKHYMRERYGFHNVCFTGTYTTLQIKGAIKDLARDMGIDFKEVNYTTSSIEEREGGWSWFELFEYAQNNPTVKRFIKNYPDLINLLYPILNQPKTSSIHASAVIITPEEDEYGNPMTIYDWMPVKMMDDLLVSEWEGKYLDKAGFLKEDILGIQQLDKIARIKELIDINNNTNFDPYTIPIDDKRVFELFQNGQNEDVFHFGSVSLKLFCKEMQPSTIEDLIAINAIYRPGPIQTGAPARMVKIKRGELQPEYDWGTEEILKSTYSEMTYQEQIMQLVQKLADFNLNEADDIRRAIGKKDMKLMQSYKEQYIQGCLKNGCPQEDAERIWGKIEEFAKYSFNKSHATCYASTGYLCNWLKVNYPLEFWTASLEFAPDTEISQRAAEMNVVSKGVKLSPPDINKSSGNFSLDKDNKIIFWSLSKVSQIGPSALDALMQERERGGEFYSIEELFTRVPKKLLRKPAFINLVFAGAFDDMYCIEDIRGRYELLKEYCRLNKVDISTVVDESLKSKTYYWMLLQKDSCGLSNFNFKELYLTETKSFGDKLTYEDELEFYAPLPEGEKASRTKRVIGGILVDIVIRNSKTRGVIVALTLDVNGSMIYCTVWDITWQKYSDQLENSKKKIIFINGDVKTDTFRKRNTLYTNEDSKIEIL